MPKDQADPFSLGAADQPIPPEELGLRLAFALGVGLAVAASYFLTQRKQRSEVSSFVSTLVLLSILLSMVTLVIGNSVARAFGLVGALSIVRFRTVVEDTRDTAFVIFAVVAGMAAGAGAYTIALIGVPVVGAVAVALAAWGVGGRSQLSGERRNGESSAAGEPPSTLVVRMGIGSDHTGALSAVLAEHLAEFHLLAASTARQGVAVDLTYAVRPRDGKNPVALLAAVNKVEGVQNVEWTGAEKK